MADPLQYESWDKDRLISRIQQLEKDLEAQTKSRGSAATPTTAPSQPSTTATPISQPQPIPTGALPAKKTKRGQRKIDPSRYSTRFIALKLAYLGKNYGGFEHQPYSNVPTIESELWAALVKTCLVFPTKDDEGAIVDFDSFEYSKCGRTDRGVSAFGQVIGIRVRSSKPLAKPKTNYGDPTQATTADAATSEAETGEAEKVAGGPGPEEEAIEPPAWHHINDELPYTKVLNKVLPSDIRILAWCPSPPPGFSARFSCLERQYRYFFTQPVFLPPSNALLPCSTTTAVGDQPGSSSGPGWLDIDAMRTAAHSFQGEHDFRNFCKVDGGKQITNFKREMFEVDVVEVEDAATALPYMTNTGATIAGNDGRQVLPRVYSFNVRGSAFLWHQIRHMVAILFLVGQGLEPASVVSDLLDVDKTPRKPSYELAHDVPLVLWDCIFPQEGDGRRAANGQGGSGEGDVAALHWVYETEDTSYSAGRSQDSMWQNWREKKIDELLANRLLDSASTSMAAFSRRQKEEQHRQGQEEQELSAAEKAKQDKMKKVFTGGNEGKVIGRYTPLSQRQKGLTPDEVNDRWAQRNGFASAEEMRNAGNWRATIKNAKKVAGSQAAGDGVGG